MALTKVNGDGVGTLSSGLTLTSDDPTITMTDSSGTNDIATVQATSGALIVTARDGSADGEIIFKKTDGSATDETMRINSSGDVGIGTNSPAVPLDVKRSSPSSGILALFGSNGTQHTSKVSSINNNITIGRSRINVPASTTTQLVNGYGGSVCLITLLPASGVADIQYTFLVTHGWNAATVLFTNTYGGNTATFTFAASSGNLTVNHNHSGAINFNVATMVVSAPTTG